MQTELDINPGFINGLIYTQIVYPPLEKQDSQKQADPSAVLFGVVTTV